MVKIMASKLRDVELITDTGIRLGWVYDLSFDEETGGEILVIVAEPDEDLDVSEFVTDQEGLLLIPISAVKSIGEVIIIDSNKLAVKSKLKHLPSVTGTAREKRLGGGSRGRTKGPRTAYSLETLEDPLRLFSLPPLPHRILPCGIPRSLEAPRQYP